MLIHKWIIKKNSTICKYCGILLDNYNMLYDYVKKEKDQHCRDLQDKIKHKEIDQISRGLDKIYYNKQLTIFDVLDQKGKV